ncbi:UNVERIFIED_CONTAM: hypothetical protein FKN15_067922 [Acipenser sinensis]
MTIAFDNESAENDCREWLLNDPLSCLAAFQCCDREAGCIPNVPNCPDEDEHLQQWVPGHNEAHRVRIGYDRKLLLPSSATVHSIRISDGGKLVIADRGQPVVLRTRHILIEKGGELHIGSEECPFKGNLSIILYGRSDDPEVAHSYFGHKYIGVGTGGTLEIHGEKKLSWTFLNKTLHPGETNEDSYHFEKSWGSRGVVVHVIDPETGEVLHSDRFDTYKSKDESRRLAQYVDVVEDGMILAMAVNDEGSNNLEDLARKALLKLGSRQFHRLGFRHPWSFITVKGDPFTSTEDHVAYQGTKASTEARSSKVFQSGYGEHFTVTASSQWVQEVEWTEWFDRDDERGSGDWEKLSDLQTAFPGKICASPLDIQAATYSGVDSNLTDEVFYKNDKDYGFVCLNKDQPDGICNNYKVRFLCGKLVRPQVTITIDTHSNTTILELAEDGQTWKAGDTIVVASTDYSMYQAEEFKILPCPACTSNQIKVEEPIILIHPLCADFFMCNNSYIWLAMVNGKKLYQPEDGVQLTVIDGQYGKVLDSKGFRNSILLGIPAQIENYVASLKDESIVIITSKGRLVTKGPWTKILEKLGAEKNVKLKDKLVFVGFKGSYKPDWVKLMTDDEAAKIHQVLPIPVVKKMKLR